VHDAAEDDIEPPDVALEVESDSVNTDTEQDKQRDHEVVDINASVGGHSDITTAQGPTPYHGRLEIADFDADQDVEQKMQNL